MNRVVSRRLTALAIFTLAAFSAALIAAAGSSADSDFPYRLALPYVAAHAPKPTTPYSYVPDSATCVPNAGVSYYKGVVVDKEGNLQNGVCVHVAFYGPRNTKCSGCDGAGNGNWGFAPFGGPAPANIPVEIFIVPCPAVMPPGGQSGNWGDLTPQSDKWQYTTTSTSMQCTGLIFQQN